MEFKENDFIFLLDDNGKKHWIKVAYSMIKIPSLGTFDGSKLKGLSSGSEVTIAGKKFVAFEPTTMDLMESLERGAQIITPKDAATIIFYTNTKAGSKVLEVGAGSGGLTTALLETVSENGHVHTIEFKEENAERALKNLKRTCLDKNWSYQIGDAREVKVQDYVANSLIMDMPDPENAIENLLPHLLPGGCVCGYVPNMNQMERFVKKLRELKFVEIKCYETMQREMEVHSGGVRPSFGGIGHTAYLIFGRKRE